MGERREGHRCTKGIKKKKKEGKRWTKKNILP
jgi:hypothetical protein